MNIHIQKAFHQAVRKNDVAAVRRLLAAGADVNGTTRSGRTALSVAVEHEHEEMCRALAENGLSAAHVSAELQGPWHLLSHDNVGLIRYLLSLLQGESLQQAKESVLLTACRNGCLVVVPMLLNDGTVFSEEIKNKALCETLDGWTNMKELTELLLAAGASARSVSGHCIMNSRAKADVVELLLQHGAEP